jgi:hypothetical protein
MGEVAAGADDVRGTSCNGGAGAVALCGEGDAAFADGAIGWTVTPVAGAAVAGACVVGVPTAAGVDGVGLTVGGVYTGGA